MSELTFGACVIQAAGNPEFVSNWMRLRGIKLAKTPIDSLVDEATGRHDAIAVQFLEDVHDLIWSRMAGDDQDGRGGNGCR